jgi:hypothetical protein
MKGLIISLVVLVSILSLVSAEIIITEQPQEVYNFGDLVSVPTTIKAVTDLTGTFQMDLLCGGHQINFYKNGISLSAGEEKSFDASIALVKDMVGELQGECKVKAILGEDYILTREFKISDFLTIVLDEDQKEFKPGENIIIRGSAMKENGEEVNGFLDVELVLAGNGSGENILQPGTINNGFFSLEILAPADMKASSYLVKLKAYEKDSQGDITNNGFTDYNIAIHQVPNNLELIIENSEIEPGTNLVFKTVLHDQTGESMESESTITIKDNLNLVMEQTALVNGEFFEYPIKYNQVPAEWKVLAESNGLITESTFTILEKADVRVDIVNKTVIITNIGNILYNKTILVKVEEESLNVDVNLEIDESEKYILNAPDGDYHIEVITEEGSEVSKIATLTGKAIGIREAGGEFSRAMKSPFIWIFIIIILGAVAFFFFKKVRKKPFSLKNISFKKKGKVKKSEKSSNEKSLINSSSKAELSLSIKGSKQDASVICLKLKNQNENSGRALQNIVEFAEEQKATIYENQNNIFFILAPIKTKTYKNEKTSVKIAQGIKELLSKYNQTASQKIDFGISLNHGSLIAKKEGTGIKFMSMGTLITRAKKIASLAKREILLSETMHEKLRSYLKTEKYTRDKITVFSIKQVKRESEENKKFIRNFLDKMDEKEE